jgi:hypothetical protein
MFVTGECKQRKAHIQERRGGMPGAAGAVAFRLASMDSRRAVIADRRPACRLSVGAMAVGVWKTPASRRALTEGWGVYSRMSAGIQFVPANIRARHASIEMRAADIPGGYTIIPGLPAMIAGLPGMIPGTPGMAAYLPGMIAYRY